MNVLINEKLRNYRAINSSKSVNIGNGVLERFDPIYNCRHLGDKGNKQNGVLNPTYMGSGLNLLGMSIIDTMENYQVWKRGDRYFINTNFDGVEIRFDDYGTINYVGFGIEIPIEVALSRAKEVAALNHYGVKLDRYNDVRGTYYCISLEREFTPTPYVMFRDITKGSTRFKKVSVWR